MSKTLLTARQPRALCVFLLSLFATAAHADPGNAEPIVSRSESLALGVDAYRFEFYGMMPQARARLERSPHAQRDFVLDLHSDTVLARQAEAAGLLEDPEVQAVIEQTKRKVLVAALMRKAQMEAVVPDNLRDLAYERFLSARKEFKTAERRRIAHILLEDKPANCPCDETPSATERATELRARLLAGEDFAELAKELSKDPGSARNGGELPGWIQQNGKLVARFEDAAFALKKVDDISEPVATKFGVHLIKLLGIEPSRQLSFEEVREGIEQKLRNEIRFSEQQRLRSAAYPDPDTIDYKALQAALDAYQAEHRNDVPVEGAAAAGADATAEEAAVEEPSVEEAMAEARR